MCTSRGLDGIQREPHQAQPELEALLHTHAASRYAPLPRGLRGSHIHVAIYTVGLSELLEDYTFSIAL